MKRAVAFVLSAVAFVLSAVVVGGFLALIVLGARDLAAAWSA